MDRDVVSVTWMWKRKNPTKRMRNISTATSEQRSSLYILLFFTVNVSWLSNSFFVS
ncbi:Uncharacterized protein APZ42_033725 [Daphnia magna]|uniref:Uncharacterized protein n=1 Tax=Daphnia magna TaxID=35525 RepID=A0A164KTQ8_9CRUS|nr:Uncharacterized protein APZ42_033725 [Daphnia magna]